MTLKTKMIIDTDPGVDDAMAILYASQAPEIDLLGLTTVFGNVKTPIATRNALRLIEMLDLDIPVAEGAHAPLVLPEIEPSHWVHGEEGFGDVPAQTPKLARTKESAAEYLVRMAREYKGELVVCPIGPVTNIADAIKLDPDFTSNCKQIVSMAGAVDSPGNITEHAEANTYHDPHAGLEVFGAGGNQVLVGLDVTTKILCSRDDFSAIANAAPNLGGFLKQASEFYIDFYTGVGFDNVCCLHDPAAIIATTHPQYFDYTTNSIRVETDGEAMGETVADHQHDVPPINWCSDVDIDAVKSLWMQRVMELS